MYPELEMVQFVEIDPQEKKKNLLILQCQYYLSADDLVMQEARASAGMVLT